ncbi:helicase-related protein [Brachybacterium tyrofermentans]|uniref:helicase-related protein n=1 Tax=Brachybacterium tyrofermentans TaxID=47848 RepID=UPI003FD4E098
MSIVERRDSNDVISPGSLVEVRDETWLVTSIDVTDDGPLFEVRGVSEFVEGTTASFYGNIDEVVVRRPEDTRVVTDSSPRYRSARLWLEATLRKSPLPIAHEGLTVAPLMLADDLPYQREAVETALDAERLRPRLLIADAVGLGKTLEIGMILSELIRRGRGRRILIVCPRHVLEQMQHEMWSRFAIPFVRLDSEGVQEVKQKLPATRNPFSYFEKVIVSMDTLKQDRFVHDLRHHRWDAVVIDESHNVTNQATQNNQLARVLAPNTDALILASATPHNGNNASFAQLISLLEPTAVTPEGEIVPEAVPRLMMRRHRYSDSVKDVVGEKWAPRKDPELLLVSPSTEETAVADEIASTWTHPPKGMGSPTSGSGAKLFPWTLAKAFLSSPVALRETVRTRLASLARKAGVDDVAGIPHSSSLAAERDALLRLDALNDACLPEGSPRSGKYKSLLDLLRKKGVAKKSPERVVVFAERVGTLGWLREHLIEDLGLNADQVDVLHGGLTDTEQQAVVESFKQSTSPLRVLVTGDVASEGVNLHQQCHELVHFDIPWSLIRIEQRNGRIDRYGQTIPPQITALLLNLEDVHGFKGDLRVLSRLLEREREAHTVLGDAASLMGKYDGDLEEKELVAVLQGAKDLDAVLPEVQDLDPDDDPFLAALLAGDHLKPGAGRTGHRASTDDPSRTGLFTTDADFLIAGLTEIYGEPGRPPENGGVSLQDERADGLISFAPSPDLQQRLRFLPQSYLKDRRVLERVRLTPDRRTAESRLRAALNDRTGTSWPDTHYLGPQHPVLDWISDRSLASLGRGEIFAVAGTVREPWVILQGSLVNRRGQTIASQLLGVADVDGTLHAIPHSSPAALFGEIGLGPDTIGVPVPESHEYDGLVARAVARARDHLEHDLAGTASADAERRAATWIADMDRWEKAAENRTGQSALFRTTKHVLEIERDLAVEMLPDRSFVRPLLVVVPAPNRK